LHHTESNSKVNIILDLALQEFKFEKITLVGQTTLSSQKVGLMKNQKVNLGEHKRPNLRWKQDLQMSQGLLPSSSTSCLPAGLGWARA
jgi:hypothetical protein